MDFKKLLDSRMVRRVIVFLIVGLILYLLRDLINLFLFTFIFAYLFYSAQKFITSKLKKIIHIRSEILTIALYVIAVGLLVLASYKYFPKIVMECKEIINQLTQLYNQAHETPILRNILVSVGGINIADYMTSGVSFLFKSVSRISKLGIEIFIALILSLFFVLEKKKVSKFVLKFKNSKMAFIYDELHYFGTKFLLSFGKVIQAQIIIATVNTILSVIILGLLGFPQLLGVGALIFVLSLIPVAGVIISLVPLSMIAFNIGGEIKVAYVLILIAALHALESYVLNPKLVSFKVKLPVFFTFMILVISENLMGVWGLIIGIPIFMFILGVLDIDTTS